jgi:hypothetical protein
MLTTPNQKTLWLVRHLGKVIGKVVACIFVPSCSDEVVNFRLCAQVFLQPEGVGLVNEFADEAFRVIGIAKVSCPTDASGHALR